MSDGRMQTEEVHLQGEIREAEGKEPKSINLDDLQPDPKAQDNFTDSDSRIMKSSNKGWDQSGKIDQKRKGQIAPPCSGENQHRRQIQ